MKKSDSKILKRNNAFYMRTMIAFACLLLFVASAVSIFNSLAQTPIPSACIIPYPYITIPICNILSFLLCLFLFFFPHHTKLQILLASVQCVLTILTPGYELLGVILLILAVCLAYFYDFLASHKKQKFALISVIWIFVTLPIFKTSLQTYLITVFTSFFLIATVFFILSNIENIIESTIQTLQDEFEKNKKLLNIKNNTLFLKQTSLSERQQKVLFLYVVQRKIYKEISNELNISESVIKHEMKEIKNYFFVTTSKELLLFFSQIEVIE